jgi:hypothetical protein
MPDTAPLVWVELAVLLAVWLLVFVLLVSALTALASKAPKVSAAPVAITIRRIHFMSWKIPFPDLNDLDFP